MATEEDAIKTTLHPPTQTVQAKVGKYGGLRGITHPGVAHRLKFLFGLARSVEFVVRSQSGDDRKMDVLGPIFGPISRRASPSIEVLVFFA